jgi:hypothetical protein
MTTTIVYHAAVRGIRLEEVESELEGDLDLQGFFAISDKVRPGYEEIRVNFKVKTDIENVDRLKALTKLSPVYDVVSNGTRVKVWLIGKSDFDYLTKLSDFVEIDQEKLTLISSLNLSFFVLFAVWARLLHL